MILKEFCAENFTAIPLAIQNGATRIELCDNLAVGGTTVSTGVMEETLSYCAEKQIPVMALIRPRGGNFVYNDRELKIMHTDLIEAKKIGVDGVVIGALTADNWLDEEALDLLIEAAEGLQITFHMAFDTLSAENQLPAMDWLADRGVTRILTHGGKSDMPIEENIEHLKKLIHYANNRLTILPGGGITTRNATNIANVLAVSELHGTKIVSL